MPARRLETGARSRAPANSRSPSTERRAAPRRRTAHDGRAVIEPTPEDEAALDATKAPLMEHLLELRKRLVWAMVSFGICFVRLLRLLHADLQFPGSGRCTPATNHLIYTALTEVFFTQVKIAMFGGALPGLSHHRRAALDVRGAGPLQA